MTILEHLSTEAQELFQQITEECDLTARESKILQAACEAWDRATEARKQIDAEGLTVLDRFGQAKAHPLLTTERDARSQFLTGMKALKIDEEDFTPRRPGRPPEIY